jgi:hypothetical protein
MYPAINGFIDRLKLPANYKYNRWFFAFLIVVNVIMLWLYVQEGVVFTTNTSFFDKALVALFYVVLPFFDLEFYLRKKMQIDQDGIIFPRFFSTKKIRWEDVTEVYWYYLSLYIVTESERIYILPKSFTNSKALLKTIDAYAPQGIQN